MKPLEANVLLVEDSAAEARLALEALEEARFKVRMHIVSDGAQAMAFLKREGPYHDAPRPDLVLLDLNLPRKDGREVLEEIKTNDGLKSIPVVVLTTSSSDADIQRSYMLHANCYISKPVDMEGFLMVVQSIDDFWLSVVKLPNGVQAKGPHR